VFNVLDRQMDQIIPQPVIERDANSKLNANNRDRMKRRGWFWSHFLYSFVVICVDTWSGLYSMVLLFHLNGLFASVYITTWLLIDWGARWPRGQCGRGAIAEAKQCSQRSVIGWVTKIYYLELLRASEGTLSRWSRMYLQSLAPTNPHWARVVGCGPFFLWVIHK
jgi:hypothetical protein